MLLYWFIDRVSSSSLIRGVRGGAKKRWWASEGSIHSTTSMHRMVGLIHGSMNGTSVSALKLQEYVN